MYISKFNIESYKSFLSSGEITLKPGFDVIVGQNNIGKSSIAEALSTRFTDKPHRSLQTSPERISDSGPLSKVTLTFNISSDDLLKIFKNQIKTFFLGHPDNTSPTIIEQNFNNLIDQNHIELECILTPGANNTRARIIGYDAEIDRAIQFNFDNNRYRPIYAATGMHNMPVVNQLPIQLFNTIQPRVYIFDAERFNLPEARVGTNRVLAPNAENLAQVLHVLSGNTSRFQKYNNFVNTIFPQIKQVTSTPISGEMVRILVWNIEPDSEREDLAFSLKESGTGVGQVLAILYVLLTADLPQVIIIDEPQSFLHPGAVRKLIDILKMFPQHQYIMTTHSPTVVTSSNPNTLLMVTKQDAESHIEEINSEQTSELGRYLSEIGARLSDVFGSDSILWVEGSTEETCFPLISTKLAKLPLLGRTILGVKHTGDFESTSRSDLAFQVYRRLSQGNGLLPKAIAFIFDREGRTEKEQEDLKNESGGLVHFLKRRMYENYLLNPAALSAIANSLTKFTTNAITSEQIEKWINDHQWDSDFFDRSIPSKERNESVWLEKVRGDKVLGKIFSEFSETRYSYAKVEHGEMLTKWLIENSPNDLSDIVELLKEIIPMKIH